MSRKKFSTLYDFADILKHVKVTFGYETVSLRDGMSIAVDLLKETDVLKQQMFLVGNGGSAGIASHIATDLLKNSKVRALTFNDANLLTCFANDFGYSDAFKQCLDKYKHPKGDLLVAISSSGMSWNIKTAAESFNDNHHVITLSGFSSDNHLRKLGDLNFYVPSKSYGVVETAHMLILHAIVDEFVKTVK